MQTLASARSTRKHHTRIDANHPQGQVKDDTKGVMDVRKIGSAAVAGFKMDDFEEQERRLLAEALHESEQHLAMTKLELSRCHAERDALQRLVTKERRRYQAIQDELDNVKLQSHHLLLCQGDELAQSVISVSRLAGRFNKLYEELQKAAEKLSEPLDCIEPEKDTPSDTSVSESHSCPGDADTLGDSGISAVDTSPVMHDTDVNEFKVDSSIKTSDEEEERGDVKAQDSCGVTVSDESDDIKSGSEDSGVPSSVQKHTSEPELPQFGSSVGSAFNPIRSRKGQVTLNVCCDGVAKTTIAMAAASSAARQVVPNLSSLDELPVNRQIDELNNMLTVIISVLETVKHGVTASQAKKQAHLQSLESALSEAQLAHQRELAVLQAGVDDSADVEHQMALKLQLLETELEETQEQLAAQEESLMGLRELLQQRTLKLEQIHDQYTYVKRLKQEVDHMTRLSQEKESENVIIAEMLQSTLARLEEVKGQQASGATGGGDAEVSYIRENLVLKKEVSHFKQRVLQIQEDATSVTEKANKRMKTLEKNWRQAERELHRLDQLLEQILDVLKNHTDVVMQWDDAAVILQEITDMKNSSFDSVD